MSFSLYIGSVLTTLESESQPSEQGKIAHVYWTLWTLWLERKLSERLTYVGGGVLRLL